MVVVIAPGVGLAILGDRRGVAVAHTQGDHVVDRRGPLHDRRLDHNAGGALVTHLAVGVSAPAPDLGGAALAHADDLDMAFVGNRITARGDRLAAGRDLHHVQCSAGAPALTHTSGSIRTGHDAGGCIDTQLATAVFTPAPHGTLAAQRHAEVTARADLNDFLVGKNDLLGVSVVLVAQGGPQAQLAPDIPPPGPDLTVGSQGQGVVGASRDGHHILQHIPILIHHLGGIGHRLFQAVAAHLAVSVGAPGPDRSVLIQSQRVPVAHRHHGDVVQRFLFLRILVDLHRRQHSGGIFIVPGQLTVAGHAPAADRTVGPEGQGVAGVSPHHRNSELDIRVGGIGAALSVAPRDLQVQHSEIPAVVPGVDLGPALALGGELDRVVSHQLTVGHPVIQHAGRHDIGQAHIIVSHKPGGRDRQRGSRGFGTHRHPNRIRRDGRRRRGKGLGGHILFVYVCRRLSVSIAIQAFRRFLCLTVGRCLRRVVDFCRLVIVSGFSGGLVSVGLRGLIRFGLIVCFGLIVRLALILLVVLGYRRRLGGRHIDGVASRNNALSRFHPDREQGIGHAQTFQILLNGVRFFLARAVALTALRRGAGLGRPVGSPLGRLGLGRLIVLNALAVLTLGRRAGGRLGGAAAHQVEGAARSAAPRSSGLILSQEVQVIVGGVLLGQPPLQIKLPQEGLNLRGFLQHALGPRAGRGAVTQQGGEVTRVVTGIVDRLFAHPLHLDPAGDHGRPGLGGLIDGPALRLDLDLIAVINIVQNSFPNELFLQIQFRLGSSPVLHACFFGTPGDILAHPIAQITHVIHVQRGREKGRILSLRKYTKVLDVGHVSGQLDLLQSLIEANAGFVKYQRHGNRAFLLLLGRQHRVDASR